MHRNKFLYLLTALVVSFYLFAAGSTLCLVIYRLTLNNCIFRIGDGLRPFWMLHPAPLIALFFRNQRFLPLAVYLLCAVALVALTGGV
jgi:hypothetical protein